MLSLSTSWHHDFACSQPLEQLLAGQVCPTQGWTGHSGLQKELACLWQQGLWGKAAQSYSAGWRAVEGRNHYRGERVRCPGAEVWYISCVYPVIDSAPESLQNSSWCGLLVTWWYRCLGWPPICCLLFPSLNLPCSLTPLHTGSAALFCSLKHLENFFLGIERPDCSQKLQVLPGQNFYFSKTLLRSSTEFGGNEKEKEWKESSSSEYPFVC